MNTIKDLQKKARELKQERQSKLDEVVAKAKADVLMTPSERAEHVASWRKEYTRRYAPQFAAIKEEAAAVARETQRQAAKARPQFDPNNSADLVRTEQAWRNVVLPQLEKGRSLKAALRNADADAVLGAERFAPAWMQANLPGQNASGLAGMQIEVQKVPGRDGGKLVSADKAVDTSAVARAVAGRFAELADPEGGAAIASAITLDSVLPAFDRYIDALDSGNGGGLDTAIGLELALSQGAGGDEPDAGEDAA
ncbi:hypothetical protein ABIC28_002041 [Rhodococcus sp. PvR044]|uniref:hypothetical protein n=1 Tax=Rhodococcus sp. PvR044 TaxID=3156402 RepID=UPI0033907FA7